MKRMLLAIAAVSLIGTIYATSQNLPFPVANVRVGTVTVQPFGSDFNPQPGVGVGAVQSLGEEVELAEGEVFQDLHPTSEYDVSDSYRVATSYFLGGRTHFNRVNPRRVWVVTKNGVEYVVKPAQPIVGPATIKAGFIAFREQESWENLGLRLRKPIMFSYGIGEIADTPTQSQSTSISSQVAVIPNDANGQFEVILESSVDLVTWNVANPGTFGGDTRRRFFRTRIVRKN